ncbi:MAG: Trm112 family protein [Henriciella sp.]|nr:Trm112 family protein [Henriciella sp.]
MTDTNTDTSNSPCGVSPRLLEVLICPVTGGPLVFDKEACELISSKAKLAFPIRDGLPILLESEARDLEASS